MAVDAYGTRFPLNAFRAVDRLVYALFCVAAVGLGPFPGVLAVVVDTATVLAQLNSGDRGRAAAGAHRAPRAHHVLGAPAPPPRSWRLLLLAGLEWRGWEALLPGCYRPSSRRCQRS